MNDLGTNMDICYLSLAARRPGEAPGVHVEEIVAGLRQRGHRVRLFWPRSRALWARPAELLFLQTRAVLAARGNVLYVRQHVLALPASLIAWLLSVPVVLEVNGPPEDWWATRPWMQRAAWSIRAVLRWELRLASAVVAVTDGLALWAEQQTDARVAVVPNAAPASMLEVHERADLGGPVVTFFGALAPWQGIETLVRATADPAWPDGVGVLMVGAGPLSELVDAHASESSGRLRRLPPLGRSELASIVRGSVATIAVMHASDRNARGLAPLKVYESMALGTPVIASDLPFMAGLVRTSGAGLVVPPDDPSAVARAVAMLATDATLRDELGRAGRMAVAEAHTWGHRAAATERVLRLVVLAGR